MNGLASTFFWEKLRDSGDVTIVSWGICGDSNAIFSMEDKISGNPNLEDIRSPNSFMHNLGLQEPQW